MLTNELKKLLKNFKNNKDDFTVSYTKYDQILIDELLNTKYLTKVNDISTLDGYSYIVRLTYKGLHYKKHELEKILDKIQSIGKFWISIILSIISIIISIIK